MDYASQLSRFVRRRVSLDLMGRCTVRGMLASVSDDHLRLIDTVIVGDLESHGWYDQMQDDEGGGPRNPETIVRIECVLHATCIDDDIPPPPSDLNSDSQSSHSDEQSDGNGDLQNSGGLTIRTNVSSLSKSLRRLSTGLKVAGSAATSKNEPEKPIEDYIEDDPIGLEIGIGLIRLADPKRGGDLLPRITGIRQVIATEAGVIVPKVRVRDNMQLAETAYRILVHGCRVAEGAVMTDRLLMLNIDQLTFPIEGVDAIEPAFKTPARWIEQDKRDRAELAGGVPIEPAAVIVTHLSEVVKSLFHELLSVQLVLNLLERLKQTYHTAIDELVPGKVSVVLLHRLLQRLLEERVSVAKLMRVVESAAYHVDLTADHDELLMRLRIDLGRDICGPLVDENNHIRAIVLDDETEEELADLAADSRGLHDAAALERVTSQLGSATHQRIIVVQRPELRRPLFVAISRVIPGATVLAAAEAPADIAIVSGDSSTELDGPSRRSLPPR